jgi:hypothetical protein
MAQRLTGDGAVALLANTLATVAALAVLIAVFASAQAMWNRLHPRRAKKVGWRTTIFRCTAFIDRQAGRDRHAYD